MQATDDLRKHSSKLQQVFRKVREYNMGTGAMRHHDQGEEKGSAAQNEHDLWHAVEVEHEVKCASSDALDCLVLCLRRLSIKSNNAPVSLRR